MKDETKNGEEHKEADKNPPDSIPIEQSIDNDGDIETQVNIGKAGDVYLSTTVDPTVPFTSKTSNLIEFYDVDLASKIFHILKKSRVIILASQEFGAVESISYCISQTSQLINLEKRQFKFNNETIKNNERLTIDWFIRNKIGKNGKNLAIFIQLNSISWSFNDSLYDQGDAFSYSITEELGKKNIYLILWANSPNLLQEENERNEKLRFPKFTIPFLPYLLSKYFSVGEAKLLEKRILEQRISGLWDSPTNEELFYNIFQSQAAKGKIELSNEISTRSDLIDKGTAEIAKYTSEHNITLTPSKIINGEESLNLPLCFVATYFESLTVREFNHIVAASLENPIIKKRYNESLKDRWNLAPDHFMEKAQLLGVYSEELDIEVIDFEERHLRQSFKEFFRSRYANYLLEQFDHLFFSKNLFLGSDITLQIFDNFSKFIASIVNSDPNHYNAVLLNTIYQINTETISDERITDIKTLIKKLEEQQALDKWKDGAYFKVAKLIAEMLKYPRLKEYNNSFWNYLLAPLK